MLTASTFASYMPATTGKAEVQHVRWNSRVIKVSISSSLFQSNTNIKADSDVNGAIRRSLQSWQAVAGIRFQIESSDHQSVSSSGVSGDGVSLITIAQTPENVLLFSKNLQAESAKTRVFYNAKGFITEADIVLNPFQQFSTDGSFGTFDLESTLTHEIGHMLGLRHSGVLGSTMANSAVRNGLFGYADYSPRTLSSSDIAAVRDIYGTADESDPCCSTITGKLTGIEKAARTYRVWAEENASGRVIAQTETAIDGGFRLGGMPAGTFSVFWQIIGEPSATQIGELGLVKLEGGETKLLSGKVSPMRSETILSYAGVNGQLSDTALNLVPGREQMVFLGGRNIDPKDIQIEFNSPYLRVVSGSIASQDFGDGVSSVSFTLAVSPDIPAGSYSIFSIAADGTRSSLIGAINIEQL